jgi:hypothetical protein
MMRVFGGYVLAFCMILAIGSAVLAEGFQMERVTIGTRWVEDEDQQNWLYFNSNADYEWTRFNLQGKFYVPSLSENWIDYSRYGMDDLYSGVKANFRFPQLSRGLDANLGYKWNDYYRVYLYGVGYNWSWAPNLTLGVHYDGAHRTELSSNPDRGTEIDPDTGEVIDNDETQSGEMWRNQGEFTLRYSPKGWGYSLTAQRIDCGFPDDADYNLLKYVFDQKFTWQATSKLDLGLRYVTKLTDYYDNPDRIDGDSDRVVLDATLKWNQYWTWSGAYSQSDYSGYDGEYDTSSWRVKTKYDSNHDWWAAVKFYWLDLYYDQLFRGEYNDRNDLDEDYNSRIQQVVALEYERKLERFTYNLEVFVKNYDYDKTPVESNRRDRTDTGFIGAIGWDWAKWRWVFRAAPNGDLTTRKANYELKATYKF